MKRFLATLALAGCHVDYTCEAACAKLYTTCDDAVVVHGVALSDAQCAITCEEGRGTSAAELWLDCIHDSVCHGDVATSDDRDLRRYDIDWCNPAFPILVTAGVAP